MPITDMESISGIAPKTGVSGCARMAPTGTPRFDCRIAMTSDWISITHYSTVEWAVCGDGITISIVSPPSCSMLTLCQNLLKVELWPRMIRATAWGDNSPWLEVAQHWEWFIWNSVEENESRARSAARGDLTCLRPTTAIVSKVLVRYLPSIDMSNTYGSTYEMLGRIKLLFII